MSTAVLARPVPLTQPSLDPSDVAAVRRVLESRQWAQGREVAAFEAEMAGRYATDRVAVAAIAVSNATSGLMLTYQALGIGPGWTVVTTPLTFSATGEAARRLGADVSFVDVDDSGLLDCNELETWFRQRPRRPQANRPVCVVPVHLCGATVDIEQVAKFCRADRVAIVEDAAHMAGGGYGRVATTGSAAAVLSFHAAKLLCTGEGGMVLTEVEWLADQLRIARDQGMTPGSGIWDRELTTTAWNFRMTDLQAALGRSQLVRVDKLVKRRMELIARYDELLGIDRSSGAGGFEDVPFGVPRQRPLLYYVVLIPKRDEVFHAMRAAGVGVQVHYRPLHLQPVYARQGWQDGQFPRAESWGRMALTLPLYADMTEEDQDFVVYQLRSALGSYVGPGGSG